MGRFDQASSFAHVITVMAFMINCLILALLAGAGLATRGRARRQAARTPLNEAITEPEGRFLDPALLSMMFSNSGIMPSLGSSTMNNA